MARLLAVILAALAALCCPGCSGPETGPDPAVLAVESGPILREASGAYLGIPYARPPVGERRFRPPAPPDPWTEPRRFDAFGPACPQADPDGPASEDCLTLNVWTPARSPSERLPVLVFLHGGAFKAGASAWEVHHGAALSEEGLVVVTLNYRLGLLGWMAHPLLSAESPWGVSGNYGLLDQMAALGWVRRNIAAFGGDPGNVTVAGQSAGAECVALLLACPRAAGLFDKAVLQSPALPGSLRGLREPRFGTATAEALGLRAAALTGADRAADPLAALRALPPEALVQADETLEHEMGLDLARIAAGPAVDGLILPDHPLALFRTGRFHKVPLLTGITADEGTVFAPLHEDAGRDPEALARLAREFFGPDANAALAALEEGGRTAPWRGVSRLLHARWFEAFARFLAAQAARSGQPAWFYRYARRLPEAPGRILAEDSGAAGVESERLGVPHGAELFALSGLTPWWMGFDDADRAQARTLRAFWARFATTGDPGGEGETRWPRFDPAAPRALEFGAQVRAVDLPADPLLAIVLRSWDARER